MAKHPIEVFGHPINDQSKHARNDRNRRWCPFVNDKCDKKSRLIDYPMGVCSVQYGNKVIALSPRRFLEDNIIFQDIADHYFNTRNNIVVFKEVGLRHIGNFDFVMVKHKAFGTDVEDFVIIEVQTAQTTSTGKLVKALEDYFHGREIEGKTYSFGLNLADIWKRTFTQVLNKGIVIEHWGNKIYWVVQEPVYQDFQRRYRLHEMGYNDRHNIVFAVYDMRNQGRKYELVCKKFESSTTGELFRAFSTNPNIPSKDVFLSRLSVKLERKMHLKLKLHQER